MECTDTGLEVRNMGTDADGDAVEVVGVEEEAEVNLAVEPAVVN